MWELFEVALCGGCFKEKTQRKPQDGLGHPISTHIRMECQHVDAVKMREATWVGPNQATLSRVRALTFATWGDVACPEKVFPVQNPETGAISKTMFGATCKQCLQPQTFSFRFGAEAHLAAAVLSEGSCPILLCLK